MSAARKQELTDIFFAACAVAQANVPHDVKTIQEAVTIVHGQVLDVMSDHYAAKRDFNGTVREMFESNSVRAELYLASDNVKFTLFYEVQMGRALQLDHESVPLQFS